MDVSSTVREFPAVTFTAPFQTRSPVAHPILAAAKFDKASMWSEGRVHAEEDSARKALGTDGQGPAVVIPGTALENLARITFG